VAILLNDSWFVPLPFWTTPDNLERYDFAMRMRREQFFHPVLVWFDEHSEAGADPAPPLPHGCNGTPPKPL